MKRILPLLPVLAAVLTMASCQSQKSVQGDPQVAAAVADVNIDSVRVYIDELVALHTRHTLSSQTDPARGLGSAVRYLAGRCELWAQAAPAGRPRPVVEQVTYTVGEKGGRYDRIQKVPELMVTLPGTEAEREILLMAHIDTRVLDVMDSTTFAPGADDDGSGLACLLETVRILSQIPLRQTVKCLFVSGEEQGLDGSSHFAAKARAEGWPVQAVLSNDMIGNVRASGTELREDHKVRVFSESRSGEDSDSRQLARYVKESAACYVPEQEVVLNYRTDRYRRGGDHSSFLRQGFTAVRICEYCEDYERTHQNVRTENGVDYGDLPSYIDFDYLVRNIRINIASIMNLAQAPSCPEDVKIANAMDLDNHTRISWKPVPGENVSYQLLYRETYQAEWEVVIPMEPSDIIRTGDVLEYSIPLSKDNYYFAVRAVSSDGHPGLPAVAK